MAETYESVRDIVSRVLLVIAVLAGGIALIDWAIRTRRINPFNPIARFFRRWIDPVLKPLETMLVRRGGQPQHAPFFAFMIVVVAGIIVIQLLGVFGVLLMEAAVGMTGPTQFVRMVLAWALKFLTFALLVRVISSWLPVSPYSRWLRWSYVSTEWILAPLRRLIPSFGQLDVTPIAAYFLLMIAGSVLGLR
jgi:YggT family protein